MPGNLNIPSPSELIKGTDIVSTFQNLYNILFAILLALAFLSFVYGAFQYLLSGASIFNQQEGKNRMKNSLIALIVVLIIPPILNLINPKIFQGVKMPIPKLTFNMPSFSQIRGDFYYVESPSDGGYTLAVDNSIFADREFVNYATYKKIPSSTLEYILKAYSYANSAAGRKSYADSHPGNLSLDSACNHFVFFVLKETGFVPKDVCSIYGASKFHEMLTKKNFQDHVKSLLGFNWVVIDFSPKKVQPGDILVRTKLINGHGHVGIAIPLKTKSGGFTIASAEASYTKYPTQVSRFPEKYLPHIKKIDSRFNLIVRPVPIK
ncbi:MAG: hypothetical protein KatS3mg093_097 [Candidatus Parcubacteria bacterium]|nr:MAG: hypothetical protein KatS3mg093_097 [Candidatus Parcubacteria bacterium]